MARRTARAWNQAGHSQPQQPKAAVPLQQAPLQVALAHRKCLQQVEGLPAHRNALRPAGAKLPGFCLPRRCSCLVDLMSLDPSLSLCTTMPAINSARVLRSPRGKALVVDPSRLAARCSFRDFTTMSSMSVAGTRETDPADAVFASPWRKGVDT